MQRDAKHGSKRRTRLGEFVNFPPIIHGSVKASYTDDQAKIQLAVIRALHNLNGVQHPYLVSVSGRDGTYQGGVKFEIGVAEGMSFHYLTDDMADKLCKTVLQGQFMSQVDFLVIVTYHYTRQSKRIPLNFDYHQLRFLLHENELEMKVFHSRGIRRMPLEEFVNRILNALIGEMRRRSLKPLSIQEFKTL